MTAVDRPTISPAAVPATGGARAAIGAGLADRPPPTDLTIRRAAVRKLLVGVALLLATGGSAVGPFARPAAAEPAPPEREVADTVGHVVAGACGFPVQVDWEGTAITLTFTNEASGAVRDTFLVTGLRATLTNVATGESLTVNITGPEFVQHSADGATISGPGPWLWGRTHPVTGEPGIWLLRGRLTFTADLDRNITSIDFVGTSENLCLALAPE